eukprot:TRINITY_DN11309_c0_g1_i2.p2 TRINITY_DN11309_c0_g1~~TRINITY_DN11309_c0_g1_i2.p2  ORF type:complete len:129 (+),score=13.90 TRINITY_DN11309_c0_g1_i2:60-389(+)
MCIRDRYMSLGRIRRKPVSYLVHKHRSLALKFSLNDFYRRFWIHCLNLTPILVNHLIMECHHIVLDRIHPCVVTDQKNAPAKHYTGRNTPFQEASQSCCSDKHIQQRHC